MKDYFPRVYEKNPDVVYRVIAGEAVLVPISKETQAAGRLFTLNAVGTFVWKQIDGQRSLADLAGEIRSEYDVDAETALRDLIELLEALEKIGAVRRSER